GLIGITAGSVGNVLGFPPGLASAINAGNAAANQAYFDAGTVYGNIASMRSTGLTGADLGGQVLNAGVYTASTSVRITGSLLLNGQNDPNAVFVFQIGQSLTTAINSKVILVNGARACNVFWQVGSGASLGAATTFVGNIVARVSITADAGVTVQGGLYTNGEITLTNDQITPQTDCAVVLPSSSVVSSSSFALSSSVVSSSAVSSSAVSSSAVSSSAVSSSAVSSSAVSSSAVSSSAVSSSAMLSSTISSSATAMSGTGTVTSVTTSASMDITTNTPAPSSSFLSITSSSSSSLSASSPSLSLSTPSSLMIYPTPSSLMISGVSSTSSLAIISTSLSTISFATATATINIATVLPLSPTTLTSKILSVASTTTSTIPTTAPLISSILDANTFLAISGIFATLTTPSPAPFMSSVTRLSLTPTRITASTYFPMLPSLSIFRPSTGMRTTFRTHTLISKHPHPRPYSRPAAHRPRPDSKPKPWKPEAVAFKPGNHEHKNLGYGDREHGGRKDEQGSRGSTVHRGSGQGGGHEGGG
ncbi:hypothetical protein DE146DRAFT_762485, partial [Phaeosphaeria sp. MPI-PUGE-AT-0046c]